MGFVDVGFYCVGGVCEGFVEEPVVYGEEGVCGKGGDDVCSVEGGWFFEACFGAAVDGCFNLVVESFGGF